MANTSSDFPIKSHASFFGLPAEIRLPIVEGSSEIHLRTCKQPGHLYEAWMSDRETRPLARLLSVPIDLRKSIPNGRVAQLKASPLQLMVLRICKQLCTIYQTRTQH
jgi:hypothetical protein